MSSVDIDDALSIGQVVEYSLEKNGKEGVFIPLVLPGIAAPSIETVGTFAAGEAVVTGTLGAFEVVNVGDKVAGAGLPNNATVKEKASSESIILSAKAAQAGTDVKLTFAPQATALTLMGVELILTKMIGDLGVTVRVHQFDGSPRGKVVISEQQLTKIDINQFFTNAGVQRG